MNKLDFNPIEGKFDLVTVDGYIPEVGADPTNPRPQTAWVLRTGGNGGKLMMMFGLGTPITSNNDSGSPTYQLSYRTLGLTTKRITLT